MTVGAAADRKPSVPSPMVLGLQAIELLCHAQLSDVSTARPPAAPAGSKRFRKCL